MHLSHNIQNLHWQPAAIVLFVIQVLPRSIPTGLTLRKTSLALWPLNLWTPMGIKPLTGQRLIMGPILVTQVLRLRLRPPPPPPTDTAPPTVTSLSIPSSSSSLTVPITSFLATDNVGVTGYLVTESSSKPNASDSGWSDPSLRITPSPPVEQRPFMPLQRMQLEMSLIASVQRSRSPSRQPGT